MPVNFGMEKVESQPNVWINIILFKCAAFNSSPKMNTEMQSGQLGLGKVTSLDACKLFLLLIILLPRSIEWQR